MVPIPADFVLKDERTVEARKLLPLLIMSEKRFFVSRASHPHRIG
jgi:predicted transcriptional regulator